MCSIRLFSFVWLLFHRALFTGAWTSGSRSNLRRTTTRLASSSTAKLSSARSRFWIDQDFSFDFATGKADGIEEWDDNVPSLIAKHCNSDGEVIAVQIGGAISSDQASRVRDLTKNIQSDVLLKGQFQDRSFGENKGGNDCTYLAPLLQVVAPDIAYRVVSMVKFAYEQAEWGEAGKLGPESLGIRTSEHLLYDGWRNLEAHKDVGSIYTIMIALRDPNEYSGGSFFWNRSFFEQQEVKPPKLSAIVFLSDTTHGVRPITHGIRESFVTELWEYDDAPLGMNRPTPEEWETFLDTSKK